MEEFHNIGDLLNKFFLGFLVINLTVVVEKK